MGRRIGILGGTFNPIHTGHLILAENARSLYQLDMVLIMPNGVAYFKKDMKIADVNDRIDMIKLAIDSNDYFILDDRETKRPGNSYTCDTINELLNDYKGDKLFYIIGADTVYNIDKWKNPEVIFDNCTILVSTRNNIDKVSLISQIDSLKERFNCDIELMNVNDIEISSTDIRDRISKSISIKYLVPDSVEKYIIEKGVY